MNTKTFRPARQGTALVLLLFVLAAGFATPARSQTIACDQKAIGTIITLCDTNGCTCNTILYAFSGTAGDAVIIAGWATGDIGANLYDPAGNWIGMPDTSGIANNSPLPLARTGIYTIRISDLCLCGANISRYSLTIASVTGQCGTQIACGQTITNTFNSPGGLRAYTFSGNEGDVVTINTYTTPYDPEMGIYDPQGNTLWQGLGSPGSAHPLTLPQTGTYTILFYAGGTGTYTFSLMCCGNLSVKLLKQYDTRWGTNIYAHYTQKTNSIAKWGCYLTSCAMLINYYADLQGTGFTTTPDVLNDWLVGQTDGYDYGKIDTNIKCIVNPHAVERYALMNGITSFHFIGPSLRNNNVLNSYLCSGDPEILWVHNNGHFIVATGKIVTNGLTTYAINDPGVNIANAGCSELSCERYDNTYQGMRLFSSSLRRRAFLRLGIRCPIEVLVTDPQGRRTGIDPRASVFDEIPDASYQADIIEATDNSGEIMQGEPVFECPDPLDGVYLVQIFGTNSGPFTIDIMVYDSNANLAVTSITGNASSGSYAMAAVNYSSAPGSKTTVTYPLFDVQRFGVVKGQQFVQSNTNLPALQSGSSSSFSAFADAIAGTVNSASLCLPTGVTNMLISEGAKLELSTNFPTKAALDAAYPNGVYTFNFNTTDDGTNIMAPLNLSGDSYPPNAPHVSNFGAAQTVRPSQDFVLTWDAFAVGTTNDYVQVEVGDVFKTPAPGSAGALNGTNTSVRIPGDLLLASQTNSASLLFVKFTASNTTNYPGSYGFAGYFKSTQFNLITTANSPSLGAPTHLPDGRFRFSVTGAGGQYYTLQTSTNLINWISLLTINQATNFFYFIDPNASNIPCRFYRVKVGL